MKARLLTLFFYLVAFVSTINAEEYTGTCGNSGNNLTWTLSTVDSTLIVEGSGEMICVDAPPSWNQYHSFIVHVTLPEGITCIGDYAFRDCENLTSLQIPDGVTRISGGAFSDCTKLDSIVIPNSVSEFGWGVFSSCSSLKSLIFPPNITEIPFATFQNCTNLSSVQIFGKVTSIAQNAFNGCYNLTTINVAQDNPSYLSIDGVLFNKDISILLKFPASNMGKGYHGEDYSYEVPSTVKYIAPNAFMGSSITSVTLPDGLDSIGESAFAHCSLKSINIPSSIISIKRGALYGCFFMSAIYVDENNPYYCDIEGVLCNKDHSVLIQYPSGKYSSEYITPSGVDTIGYEAFSHCSAESVILSNDVTTIEESAFGTCDILLTISSSVTHIGRYAFSGELQSITCYATIPPVLEVISSSVTKSVPLYVPAESVYAYRAANQWKEFANIQAIPGTEPETEEVNCDIRYVDKNSAFISSEQLTFHVPEAPEIEGFTFIRWEFVGSAMSDGLTIQAVYTANVPTSAPATYTNPANPAQKLIRNGNVYILTGDKTYTVTGQEER